MKAHVMSRFAAGLFVTVPLVALFVAIAWLFEFFQWLGEPFFQVLDTGTRFNALIENILAFFAALFVVYLLGFVANMPVITTRLDRLDRVLATLIPGYNLIKGVIGGVIKDDSMVAGLRPVLVELDRFERVGFEIERNETGRVVVYLPNAPAASSGQMVMVKPEQVTQLNLSPHQVLDMQGFYGAGMSKLVEQGLPEA